MADPLSLAAIVGLVFAARKCSEMNENEDSKPKEEKVEYYQSETSKENVFEIFHGKLETAPMIQECRFTAECEVVQKVMFEIDTVYFGEVVGVYVDEEALADGAPDWKKIDPLIFTFPDNGYWKLGEYVAKAWEIGSDFKPKK